jgi:type IX secretion system PorP/SprF family membrane protein
VLHQRKNIVQLALIVTAMTIANLCSAQQQPMYTQYMFNGLAINPAYAGAHESFEANALYRKQWVGIDDAPQTQSFSMHTPLDRFRTRKRPGSKVSIGMMVFNDRIAITNQNGFFGVYAYRLSLSNRATLSLGIQAGVSQMQIKYSALALDDPSFSIGDIMEWVPNFGGGLFYATKQFYAGLSTPHILQRRWDDIGAKTAIQPQWFLSTGYVIPLQQSMKLKPNLLVKSIKGNPAQLDLNCNLFLSDAVEAGVSWRSFESFAGMVRIAMNRSFTVGYAYDIPSGSDLSTRSNGSHEFMVSYHQPLKKVRGVNPRYF